MLVEELKEMFLKCEEKLGTREWNTVFGYLMCYVVNESEEIIIREVVFQNKGYQEVAKRFGHTKEWVRLKLAKAKNKIIKSEKDFPILEKGLKGAIDEKVRRAVEEVHRSYANINLPEIKDAYLSDPILKLGFSCRTHNLLWRSGIKTVYDVARVTENELWKIRNMGGKSVKEVMKMKLKHNLFIYDYEKPVVDSNFDSEDGDEEEYKIKKCNESESE